MTTKQVIEWATGVAEKETISEFLKNEEAIKHFKNEAIKFLLKGFDVVSLEVPDTEILDAAIGKMCVFWLEANGYLVTENLSSVMK